MTRTTATTADELIEALLDLGYKEKLGASTRYRVFRKCYTQPEQLVLVDQRGNIYRGASVGRAMASPHMKNALLEHLQTMRQAAIA